MLVNRPLLRRVLSVVPSLLVCAVTATVGFGCDAGRSSSEEEDLDAVAGTSSVPVSTAGNPAATGGQSATSGGSGGQPASGGGGGQPTPPGSLLPSIFGTPQHSGQGVSSDRWHKTEVQRDGANYLFMANGWGPGFGSQSVSWLGTSFNVTSMQGSQGAGYEPASYPTMFCGAYSDSKSGACGLPKALAGITSLRTGWRWKPNGNTGEYNAAYDIWLSSGPEVSGHSAFLMVWLREPKGQQPAGARKANGVTVTNAPGTWNLWAGNVVGKPCISYVRAEGQDSVELEIDVMDFVRDVPARQLSLPGSHVLSVAVGFEIWNGPITNLESQDFYVSVQ